MRVGTTSLEGEEPVFGVERARVLRPPRARLPEALAAVDGITHGPAAWEALEARGLLPLGTVGAPGRAFGAWVVHAGDRARRYAVERPPPRGTLGASMRLNEASPPLVGLAVALASDWPGVCAAEQYARVAWEHLRPWVNASGPQAPPVCWRLGEGSTSGDRGLLWIARGYAAITAGQPIEDAGELRSELRRRAARVVGEVGALEDGWCARVLSDDAAATRAARDARDEERSARGERPLGRAVRAESEPTPIYWARGELDTGVWTPLDWGSRVASRFSTVDDPRWFEKLPDWPLLRDPFEPLVAVWNLGYAPIELGPRALVLEAPYVTAR